MALSLTILGSSGALPAIGRFPTSQHLIIHNRHCLIDCGEGAQIQLARYQLSAHKIEHIFISHLHGDHYLGLMPLLFSMHLHKRTTDLHLHAPKGLDEIILLHLIYSKSVLSYQIVFHAFDPAQALLLWEDDAITVHTIPLHHKIDCAGFLFREKEKPRRIDKTKLQPGMKLQHLALLKTGQDVMDEDEQLLYKNSDYTLPPRPSHTYAYCSDTAYHEAIIEQIAGADLLYHEASFMTCDQNKAQETRHSTAAQAAQIAGKAEVKKLLIGHFSARYKDLNLLLAEAKEYFPSTALALEGETFSLTD